MGPQLSSPLQNLSRASARIEQLVHEQSRINRVVRVRLGAPLVDVGVPLLDEEPVVFPPLGRVHERPSAPELVASELEEQFAVPEAVLLARYLDPNALVPADGGARPVLPLRNYTLEFGVLKRMRLNVHREPLVRRVRRGTLGHSPGLERPVHLQAEIPVKGAGAVLLHHEEAQIAVRFLPTERLRGFGYGALFPVALQPAIRGRAHVQTLAVSGAAAPPPT